MSLLPQTSNAPVPQPVTAVPGQIFSTTTGSSIDPGAEHRGFDFRHFWHSLLEKLWIVALCVLAGFFLALGYLARTPKLYQARIVLEVDVQDPTPIRADDSSSRMRTMFLASQEAMRTIEQNLVNRSLLARVIRAEGLAEDGGRTLLGRSTTNNEEKSAAKVTPAPSDPSTSTLASQPTFTPLEEGLAGAFSGFEFRLADMEQSTQLLRLVSHSLHVPHRSPPSQTERGVGLTPTPLQRSSSSRTNS